MSPKKNEAAEYSVASFDIWEKIVQIYFFWMISAPCLIAFSFSGSIFHARSGSDFFRPIITFSIATTGRTFR